MMASPLPPLAPSLLRAHAARDGDPLLEGPRERGRLPGGFAHLRAEGEVGVVAGAEGVAVHEERALAVQVDRGRVGDEAEARLGAEPRGDHEVAVAVHEERGHRPRGRAQERRDMRREVERQAVVARPVLEEVAEDVERVRPRDDVARGSARSAPSSPGLSSARCRSEMKRVRAMGGSEEGRPAGRPSWLAGGGRQRHSAFSITTGSSGTFWCMPALPGRRPCGSCRPRPGPRRPCRTPRSPSPAAIRRGS